MALFELSVFLEGGGLRSLGEKEGDERKEQAEGGQLIFDPNGALQAGGVRGVCVLGGDSCTVFSPDLNLNSI